MVTLGYNTERQVAESLQAASDAQGQVEFSI